MFGIGGIWQWVIYGVVALVALLLVSGQGLLGTDLLGSLTSLIPTA